MIKCPHCKHTFDVFDKDTHEKMVDFTVELDCNFNGVYILNCPKCGKKIYEYPWNVFDKDYDRWYC